MYFVHATQFVVFCYGSLRKLIHRGSLYFDVITHYILKNDWRLQRTFVFMVFLYQYLLSKKLNLVHLKNSN